MAGFSMVELLVVIGVVAILMSFVLPALGGARMSSRRVVWLSNARQIGIAVMEYATTNREYPPVFYPPVPAIYPGDEPFEPVIAGRRGRGFWFDHQADYHFALSPAMNANVLHALPGRQHTPVVIAGVPTHVTSDYWLTETLYAEPSFWDRFTQRGPEQWKPQRLVDIRFPSSKGLVYQVYAYGLPKHYYMQQIPQFDGEVGAVAWADASADNVVQSQLRPGEPNFWDHYALPPATYLDNGWAIRRTKHGIFGRDR